MADVAPDLIFHIASGFMAAKHLFVANEIGVFKHLGAGSATLEELARRVGVQPRPLRIVVDAMVALGLVERFEDRYRNAPVAEIYLTGLSRVDLRGFLRYWHHIHYPRVARLEEAVRSGRHVFAEGFTEEEQRIYSEGVESHTALPANALAATYDFSRHRRVLDLGGGTGSFMEVVLAKYPHLESTLYDFHRVIEIARRRLMGSPFEKRVRVMEGDLLKDPIPDGHDVVLLANVNHLLSPEHNIELLRRIRDSVPDGARLLLADTWTDRTHTRPLVPVLMAGTFLITSGEGDVYSEDEARQWLQETGWRVVGDMVPLTAVHINLIVAETAGL